MKKLNRCTNKMAIYLWRKWKSGDITERQIYNIFTLDAACDVIGGWFADFYYEGLGDYEDF